MKVSRENCLLIVTTATKGLCNDVHWKTTSNFATIKKDLKSKKVS